MVHIVALGAWLLLLRVQLKFFKKWSMGLKFMQSLKLFYISLAVLLMLTIVTIALGILYERQTDPEAILRYNIALQVMHLICYIARKTNSSIVAYMTWKWTE